MRALEKSGERKAAGADVADACLDILVPSDERDGGADADEADDDAGAGDDAEFEDDDTDADDDAEADINAEPLADNAVVSFIPD